MARAQAAMTDAFMYQRILAKDRGYDGRFLTGVLTTGIYCLPSCPARKPKAENVRFFRREDEAIAEGLRPCRRCRPELFYRGEDWDRSLYLGLLQRLRDDPARFTDIADLAKAGGISSTKLNDLVRAEAHLTPAALLHRERIRLACELLLWGKERVIDIAHAVGYDGEATFHRQFLAATGMTPGAYRDLRRRDRFQLQLPADFRADEALAYHGRDKEGPAERRIGDHRLVKALLLDGKAALLDLTFAPAGIDCRVVADKSPSPTAMAEAHRILVRMIGLGSDAGGFEARARRDAAIRRLTATQPGLRIPLTPTVFEALAWAIIGQQINLAFATSLRRDLIELAGRPVSATSGMRLHPDAAAVAALDPGDLTSRRFSRSKAAYLIDAAKLVAGGELDLPALADGSARHAETQLLALRGLGPWTVNYIMLRGFGFADAVPVGDSALATALQRFHQREIRPDARETAELMAGFSPHRSLATCHFWASLHMAA
ncbi:MAG TPA: Ada metal-binding domain-containing protein [Dongiaceae bacterium]|nr:Ada metal-binding domain-containing protein [Dongiaceae bacterium]